MSSPEGASPAAPEGGTVARNVATGAAFMVVGRLAMRLISIVNILILARLLAPDDFGIIMLSAVAVALLDGLTALQYGVVVVRRPTVDRGFYDTAWTLNLLRCLLLAVLLAASAGSQAWLLGDPRAEAILYVVAANTALEGLHSVGLLRLEREMRFDRLFHWQVVGKAASFIFTIVLALVLGNYWCLVLGNLLSKVVTLPFSYWLAPHRPRFAFRNLGEFLHFSKWMVVVNLCQYVELQAANLAIGRFVGVQALGLWGVSYQLASAPVTELAVPMRGPIFAGYSRVQNDRDLLMAHYIAGFGLMATILVPLSFGIALVAPQLQALALGPKFDGAAPLIVLCALYALVECLAHFTGGLFYIRNMQRELAITYVGLMALRIGIVIPAGIFGGLISVGAAMLLTGLLGCVTWHWLTGRLMGVPLRRMVAELVRPGAAGLAMVAAVVALQRVLPPADGAGAGALMLQLALLAAVGAAVHVPTQLLLWWLAGRPVGAEGRLLTIARAALRRVRARLPI